MSATPKRLFLIDGYALIYRAFFAMISRPLTTSRGENTSAAWGVANFLHRLFEEHHPDYVAWVHDSGSSFRDEIFPEYKATREKLDDELQADFDRSIERIIELLRAWQVPVVQLHGYEADDVIGSLADQAAARGLRVVIVSGDKDFYQLVGPNVSLLNPGRRGPASVDEQWVDESNAHERLGVSPERVIDYLALVGDSSDNVPGVHGVGDKTARKLIEQFGDLDAILAHADEVAGKRAREALKRDADNARLSRTLVTIQRDLPVDCDLDALAARSADPDQLLRIYGELEFHTLVERIDASPTTEPEHVVYEVASTVQEVEEVVATIRHIGTFAIDVVIASPPVMQSELVGVALAANGRVWYLPFGHRPPGGELLTEAMPANLPVLSDPAMRGLVEIFGDPSLMAVGHDLKTALLVLRRAGVALRGLSHDTMLASFVIDPGHRSHALEVLAQEQLNQTLSGSAMIQGKGKSARSLDVATVAEVAQYACARLATVVELQSRLALEMESRGGTRLFHEIEMPLIEVLADLEWEGIELDREAIARLSTRFGHELVDLEKRIYHEAGAEFNINSTPQLRHVLFEKLQLPVIKRTKTGPSTDADVLMELAAAGHALPEALLEYRELSKLQSTYTDALPRSINRRTGRIHTTFSQTGAATGRLSSSDPNLQNIPIRTARGEEIRRCFVAKAGCRLIVADYSQIELRLLAHLSGDEAFVRAFKQGDDVHRETAATIFDVPVDEVTGEMRARAKTINFATIYGQGAFSLARQLSITQDEAKAFIRLYFERFEGVRRYLDACVERAKRKGYVETLFDRRRYIPELKDRNYNIRAFGERVAMNSPLQGSAADLIKHAMIGIWNAFRERGLESHQVLQVHDELILEAPDEEVPDATAILRREMEQAAALTVPLVVDIGVGPNWVDAKA